MPNPRNTPCKQLTSLGEKQYFKDKMGAIKANVDNGTKEFDFVLHENINTPVSFILLGTSQNNTNAIDYNAYYSTLPVDLANTTYGNAHNHLKTDTTHIGIFAPFDLNSLAFYGTMESNPQSPIHNVIPKKSVTYVITNIGLFALKITDLSKLNAFVMNYGGWSENEIEKYMTDTFQNKEKYNIRHNSTHDEQVTGFLRFLKDQDIGIELYEGSKDTYQNWKKLELVNNGSGSYSFNEIPCNL